MARNTDIRLQNQVIYSIYVRNHTPQGTFRAVIPDLDRIRALGTDILWLMPIHPIGEKGKKGSLGCPYANRDYRAVNPEYGTMEDFRALVDAIHARGMKCIIDVVYNHTAPDSTLLAGHPDDEILWFAGLMPVYAGERGLRVQNAIMVPTGGERKLEVLGAIWHCGVTAYPEFIGLVDKNGKTVENQYSLWRGKNRVLRLVTEVIRKHQPEVIVTHGEKGEYGHGAHKTTCDAAKNAVKAAAKANRFPQSAKEYGIWQVRKLYLHEYGKNTVMCDWEAPLAAFGGKTGFEVAEEAFNCHQTQIKRGWSFEAHGTHDNAAFGLYYTDVGRDTGTGDLMEHIQPEN